MKLIQPFLTILLNLKKKRKRKFKTSATLNYLLKKIYCPKIVILGILYCNAGLSKKTIPMMVANLGPLIPDLSA